MTRNERRSRRRSINLPKAALVLVAAMSEPGNAGEGIPADVSAGSGPEAHAAGFPPAAFNLVEFGRNLYVQRCSSCHAIASGASSIAPPLDNIIGRRAGTAAGYDYSVKLAGSDLVWDQRTLDDWLAKSTIATPDIRFRHVGMRDPIERLAVVSYIAAANSNANGDSRTREK